MTTVHVSRVISTLPAFARAHDVVLPRMGDTFTLGAERGHGGFGTVRPVVGHTARPGATQLTVKIPDEDCDWLGDSVEELHRALRARPADEWVDLLLAVPFVVAEAEVDGAINEVTFMLDLFATGYRSFEKEELLSTRYQTLPEHHHIEYAYSYARAAAFLESIRFLHGDQNEPNLLFDEKRLDAQIVDLDSGAVVVRGDERARVAGKPGDSVPPEVKGSGESPSVDKSRWDLGAERWSVGYLIGYLVFGVPPLFFIEPTTKNSIDAYSHEGPWPEVNFGGRYFKLGTEAIWEYWLPFFEEAPGDVTATFVQFFRAGIDGGLRPSAQDWADALDEARQKPRFLVIELNPQVAPEGTEVVLSWKAEGAEYVEHPTLGRLASSGEAKLVAAFSGREALTAVNYYGRVEQITPVLRVVPLPTIRSIPIQGFPALDLDLRVAAGFAPRRPGPAMPPRLTQSVGVPPMPPAFGSGPRPALPAPRFAGLFKPIPVPRQIRSIMRKERS